jgi:hypothetical protein
MTPDVEIRYRRQGTLVRFTHTGDPNEIQQVLIGVWAGWPPEVRLEFMAALAHYQCVLTYPNLFPDRFLPPLAETIRSGKNHEAGIDIAALKRAEHVEGPDQL